MTRPEDLADRVDALEADAVPPTVREWIVSVMEADGFEFTVGGCDADDVCVLGWERGGYYVNEEELPPWVNEEDLPV